MLRTRKYRVGIIEGGEEIRAMYCPVSVGILPSLDRRIFFLSRHLCENVR